MYTADCGNPTKRYKNLMSNDICNLNDFAHEVTETTDDINITRIILAVIAELVYFVLCVKLLLPAGSEVNGDEVTEIKGKPIDLKIFTAVSSESDSLPLSSFSCASNYDSFVNTFVDKIAHLHI